MNLTGNSASQIRWEYGGLLVYGCGLLLLLKTDTTTMGAIAYLHGAAFLFIGMVALWKWWPERWSDLTLWVLALASRLMVIWISPHSNDLYRYLWEGHIQLHGFNPFVFAPNAPELNSLRTGYWHLINHPNVPTLYWPAAQLLFKACAFLWPSALFLKIIFALHDLGIGFILYRLLREAILSRRHLILYLLNPLVLIFIAGEGHLETVMIFWIMAALYCQRKKHLRLMFMCLATAIMVKAVALIALLALLRKSNIRFLHFMLIGLPMAVPYLQDQVPFHAIPWFFATQFSYNGLVYSLLSTILQPTGSLYGCILIMGVCVLLVFILTPDPTRSLYLVIGGFLLCSPTVHPWYFLMVTPFLPLFRSIPWGILHLTSLPLLFYFDPCLQIAWLHHYSVLGWLEYFPFICSALYCASRRIKAWPVLYGPVSSLAVVIPTYNEESAITRCIASIQQQTTGVEIIVADGGSTDRTMELANAFDGVQFHRCAAKGRGRQIREGIALTRADCILVVHADARVANSYVVQRILNDLNRSPSISGGAVGARYDSNQRRFKVNEYLNGFRSRFMGISFGDQGQFFRKQALPKGFPDMLLMEDIELSLRLKENGVTLHQGGGIICSARRWHTHGFWGTFFNVIVLFSLFLFMRALDILKEDEDGEFFYRHYYKNRKAV